MAEAGGDTIRDWIAAGPYGTKSALAKRCGVTPTEVGRWAQGVTFPPERHWRAIAAFFGKPKGAIVKQARAIGAKAGDADLARRVAALERKIVSQQSTLEDLRVQVRDLVSALRSQR